MMWLGHRWWSFVLLVYRLLGHPEWAERHFERQGMRRAYGGRYGRWEVNMGRVWGAGVWGSFKIWLPSPCEHYPPPPCVTSTEPLEIEEW